MELLEMSLEELSLGSQSFARMSQELSQAGTNQLSLEDMPTLTNTELLTSQWTELASTKLSLLLMTALKAKDMKFSLSKGLELGWQCTTLTNQLKNSQDRPLNMP